MSDKASSEKGSLADLTAERQRESSSQLARTFKMGAERK